MRRIFTPLKKKFKIGKKGFVSFGEIAAMFFVLCLLVGFIFIGNLFPEKYSRADAEFASDIKKEPAKVVPVLDIAAYDAKLLQLAHIEVSTTTSIATASSSASSTVVSKPSLWPVKTVYPNVGAILPFKRVVSYYGNLYSTKMGVLGEYPEDEMLAKLTEEAKKWEAADPTTPVQPALHYIVATAQASAGADGKYRFRMPDSQIDEVLRMAAKINAIVFLDIQVGLSTLQSEIPAIEKYLKMPNVHLGIDPEFSMKYGNKPGTVIGTFDATDINYAAEYLAKMVRENNLPPKILVIHRFTEAMVTNYQNITPLPEVQVVMDMDGWGIQARKINTYKQVIYSEPVQFTGFKLFYKNDFKEKGSRIMTPEEVLQLTPAPIYIQYQ